MKHMLTAFAIICLFATPVLSQGTDSPPVVEIYDLIPVAIDSMAVQTYEPFSLIGIASGDVPLYYFWYLGESNPELIATGQYLLDYEFSEPGEYIITLEVIDVNNVSGSDSVLIEVMQPVATESSTWGFIKELYR